MNGGKSRCQTKNKVDNGIVAHYWNDYPDQVHVVMRDVETGAEQTIISNRIHPYFVQTKRKVANSSEGHVYAGVLDDGHWVELSAFSFI